MSRLEIKCEKCGQEMREKEGRFGKFLACSGFPDCRNTKPLNEDGSIAPRPEAQLTNEKCPECGSPLQIKHGRFGQFFGCTKYPDCRYIKNIEKETGLDCPACGQGKVIEKRSRAGRTFYACNQYPKCKYALWSKPTGEKCPDCQSALVFGKNNTALCSNKECKYKKEI